MSGSEINISKWLYYILFYPSKAFLSRDEIVASQLVDNKTLDTSIVDAVSSDVVTRYSSVLEGQRETINDLITTTKARNRACGELSVFG